MSILPRDYSPYKDIHCRPSFWAAFLSLFLLAVLPGIVSSASDLKESWARVPAELQEPLQQTAEKSSKSLEVAPSRIYHSTDGKFGLVSLPRQPYVTSSGVSWFLPGVDKDGKQVPLEKGKRRRRAYGDAHFNLSLVQIYGIPPEKILETILAERKLAKERQRLQTEGFRINYDLKEKEIPEAKKRVHDPLMAQAKQMREAQHQKAQAILKGADDLKRQRHE